MTEVVDARGEVVGGAEDVSEVVSVSGSTGGVNASRYDIVLTGEAEGEGNFNGVVVWLILAVWSIGMLGRGLFTLVSKM